MMLPVTRSIEFAYKKSTITLELANPEHLAITVKNQQGVETEYLNFNRNEAITLCNALAELLDREESEGK